MHLSIHHLKTWHTAQKGEGTGSKRRKEAKGSRILSERDHTTPQNDKRTRVVSLLSSHPCLSSRGQLRISLVGEFSDWEGVYEPRMNSAGSSIWGAQDSGWRSVLTPGSILSTIPPGCVFNTILCTVSFRNLTRHSSCRRVALISG